MLPGFFVRFKLVYNHFINGWRRIGRVSEPDKINARGERRNIKGFVGGWLLRPENPLP